MGLPLFDKGFVNFTIDKQYENFTQIWRRRRRYVNNLNAPVAQSTVTGVAPTALPRFPRGNAIPNTFLPASPAIRAPTRSTAIPNIS